MALSKLAPFTLATHPVLAAIALTRRAERAPVARARTARLREAVQLSPEAEPASARPLGAGLHACEAASGGAAAVARKESTT
jgi:hypothetical protein